MGVLAPAINVLSGKWKANTNTDLVRPYDTVASRLKEIRFKWVKGHSGIEWNEHVDNLVNSETARIAKEYNIPLYNAKIARKTFVDVGCIIISKNAVLIFVCT